MNQRIINIEQLGSLFAILVHARNRVTRLGGIRGPLHIASDDDCVAIVGPEVSKQIDMEVP